MDDITDVTLLDPEDDRYYLLPDTGERFRRVTSALVAEGEGFQRWGAGCTADAAFEELPALIKATRIKPCGNTYSHCKHEDGNICEKCPCHECEPCLHKYLVGRQFAECSRRADEGTRIHKAIEHWVIYEKWLDVDDDIKVYMETFKRFVIDYGIKPDDFNVTEATVINREYWFAGTTDGIIHLEPRTDAAAELIAKIVSRKMRIEKGDPKNNFIGVTPAEVKERWICLDIMLDWKSREKDEPFIPNKFASQLSAYLNSPRIRLKTALHQEIDMPHVDAAMIVQIRPDGYEVRPVVADKDAFEAFVNLWKYRLWCHDHGTESVSKKSFARKTKTPPRKKPAKKATVTEKVTPKVPGLGECATLRVKEPDDTPESIRAEMKLGGTGMKPIKKPPVKKVAAAAKRRPPTLTESVLGKPEEPQEDSGQLRMPVNNDYPGARLLSDGTEIPF